MKDRRVMSDRWVRPAPLDIQGEMGMTERWGLRVPKVLLVPSGLPAKMARKAQLVKLGRWVPPDLRVILEKMDMKDRRVMLDQWVRLDPLDLRARMDTKVRRARLV